MTETSSFIDSQNAKINDLKIIKKTDENEQSKAIERLEKNVPIIWLYKKPKINESISESLTTTVTAQEIVQNKYFLPKKEVKSKDYTLVLDLDETLIHYPDPDVFTQDQDFYLLRPGLHKFLDKMVKYFEIVIFTAGTQQYADYILDQIDFKSTISHRLYRHHTKQEGDVYWKDLNELGRDLK